MNNLLLSNGEWGKTEDARKIAALYPKGVGKSSVYDDKKNIGYMDLQNKTANIKVAPVSFYDSRVEDLANEIKELKETVQQLAEQRGSFKEEAIILRDVPYKKAKEEITSYFQEHDGEAIDPADIQEALGIDVFLAMGICEELESGGEIKAV